MIRKVGNSLALRLAVWFLLLSFLPLGVMAIFVRHNITNSLRQFSIAEQRSQAGQLAALLAGTNDLAAAQRVSRTTDEDDSLIFVMDRDGVYIAHTDPERAGAPVSADFAPETVARILRLEKQAFIEESSGRLIGSAPVPGQQRVVVVVANSIPSDLTAGQIERDSALQLAASLALVSVASGLVIWLFVGRPLRQMTRASQQISQGDLSASVNSQEMVDEMEVLADNFNRMARQLRELFTGMEERLVDLRKTEAALAESEKLYRLLVENSLQGLVIAQGVPPRFLFANRTLGEILGCSVPEILAMTPERIEAIIHPDDRAEFMRRYMRLLKGGMGKPNYSFRVVRKDGTVRWVQALANAIEFRGKPAVQATFMDITEQRRGEDVQFALRRLSEAALTMQSLDELFPEIHRIIGEVMPAHNFYIALQDPATGLLHYPYFVDEFDSPPPDEPPSGLTGYLFRMGEPLFITPENFAELETSGKVSNVGTPSLDWLGVPLKDRQGKTFGVMVVQTYSEAMRYTRADAELLELVSAQVAMLTERKQAQAALKESESKFRGVVEQSIEGIVLINEEGRVIEWNSGQELITGIPYAEVIDRNIWDVQYSVAVHAGGPEHYEMMRDLYRRVLETHQAEWLNQNQVTQIRHRNGSIRTIESVIYPIQTETHFLLGSVTRDITERQQMETALRESEANLTAVIENSDDRIWSIDNEYRLVVANSAFVQNAWLITGLELQPGDSMLWEGVRSGDYQEWKVYYDRALRGEKFSIEMEMRQLGRTSWLEFHFNPIRSADGQVSGVAIVERDVTQSRLAAIELARAYDTTLEGWSRALDLRDRETEGHARRVTELTVGLARLFGIREPELIHIRRGALLHDIGKMGIPDEILRKPDRLNEAEWAIMRRHPDLALGMLAPIAFLRPALDIPYCHHERWDGSGYPRGLKSDEIPLSARIFAIVDVWDALISERPYSSPWTPQQALDYIRGQSGKHFDPEVVLMFEQYLQRNEAGILVNWVPAARKE